jgi:crotonobetainyl-CoA:carnitine CoA-transferase CaiB-like acyl-CoA transferase
LVSDPASRAHSLADVSPAGGAYRVAGEGCAADYTAALIASLGGRVTRVRGRRDPHPAVEWARSGAMALTGAADGPPLLAPGPLASCARAAADAIALLAGERWRTTLDGPALLGERAAIFGASRRGTTSPGGTCRLLRAADRWIAVNLARPDDVSLLPAWLGEGPTDDPWRFAAERVAQRPAAEVVEQARLLGLPAAVAADPRPDAPPWCRVAARGPAATRANKEVPLVIDLSSLWAGPLCAQLLALAGARVVKVESARRPDGARSGPPGFFDLMNAGKASVALDFGSDASRAQLRRLVERADIVVESSRPRALAQLGIDAAALVASVPGVTWVSITGYGRGEPGAGWVAFGDDAGVAAGLAVATGPEGGPPLFCGDAIADPLTGLHAAVSALASWSGGGGHLLDLALCDVAAHTLAFDATASEARVRRAAGVGETWEVVAGRERAAVAGPRARSPEGAARSLGADTAAVLAELGIPC